MHVQNSVSAATIVNALRHHVLTEVGRDARVVSEMPICGGSSRADLVAINGLLSAYEVKSARDSLSRLESQATYYGRCFERVTIVCASRHLAKALERIPEWWGVLEVDETKGAGFVKHRAPLPNPAVDSESVAGLLWHHELRAILGSAMGTVSGRLTRRQLIQIAVSTVPPNDLLSEARVALKRRPKRWPGRL